MATKNIDSISVFLETVDAGVRSARINGSATGHSSRALALSTPARSLLEELRAAPDGAAPVNGLHYDAVEELLARRLAVVDGDEIKLSPPGA